ncbi:MAG: hypothetical protein IKO61_08050 [Lachnospiraceae bacterium]|nr:hypothetical protein [Lachnospiraceae bacterium]
MKRLSVTLSSLAALISLLTAVFGIIFGVAVETQRTASRDYAEPSINEHRLGMHKANAPVQIKKATTTEEHAATQFTSTEDSAEQVRTEEAEAEQVSTERTSEQTTEQSEELTLEQADVQTTEQASKQASEPTLEQTAVQTTEQVSEQTAAQTTEQVSEQTAAQTSEQATEASVPCFVYSETGDLLAGVNTLRAAYGLSPLSGDSLLDAAAATRAAELTVCMSHTRPDGRPASSIITDYGISCSYHGENIAAGYALPGSVLTGWEESPSHLENLLNPVFTRAGISHTVTDTGYLDYWVILLSD